MSQQFSISTIREPDTCSAGASVPYCTTRWDPVPFQETTTQGDERGNLLAFDVAAESSTSAYIARPEYAGYRSDDMEWTILLFCHWLIDRIPEEGLAELAESLANIYSFYQTRSLPTRSSLPSATRVKAFVREPMERPPFAFEISEG